MQKLFSKHQFVLFTFLAALAVLFFFYHDVLLAPNDYLFSGTGDGIKNYYTYIYHAKYDTSFSQFSGMNYPYGAHIVYTDAHPLLSWFIGKLGLVGYGVGILNILMLLSYPIGAVFIFKILRHYKVANLWAIIAAIAIAFLSPQVYRLSGHYAMSYVFAVPIMWWLLIKCYTGKKWLWSALIGVYLSLFFFTHPYLGIILLFFSFVFWLIQMVIDRKKFLPSMAHILIQVVLPILIFQGFVALTDTHIDRLSNPAGFFHYYANWNSLLVAHDGPLSSIYSFFDIRMGDWELWSYIGFSTLLFGLVIGFNLIRKRKEIHLKSFLKQELILFIIAAYLILLFAFCFPLKYDWLRWVTDILGPLKQFRILGRFTWIFYYVITVACTVGIYKLFKKYNHKGYQVFFFLGISFSFFEFWPVHNKMANEITLAVNAFKIEAVDSELKEVIEYVKAEEYDAIIFLPFHHLSSENIILLGAEEANYDAFLLSYHANIPLFNSSSSRMSLTESIKVNNYFSPRFIEKELTYDFPKNDRIVIVKNRNVLKPTELNMLWQSDKVFENEDFAIFDFDPNRWNNREQFDKIITKSNQATVNLRQGWKSDTTNVWFYYESFDSVGLDLPANEKLDGKGAYKDSKKSWNTILSLDKSQISPGDYTIRFWYYLRVDRPDVLAAMEGKFVQQDSSAWIATCDVKQSTLIVEDWCLIEMEFTVSPNLEALNILLTGNGNGQPFIIDELLIQKQNDPALFKRTEINGTPYLYYNNYLLKENSFE